MRVQVDQPRHHVSSNGIQFRTPHILDLTDRRDSTVFDAHTRHGVDAVCWVNDVSASNDQVIRRQLSLRIHL